MRILVVGGLVPWHTKAGGGQIIAHKSSQALAGVGHDVHYLAIASEEYQRLADWGEVAYVDSGPGLLAFVPWALQLERSHRTHEYDIVHVHSQNETVGYCLAHALARRMAPHPKFVMSIYAPKSYAFPRSVGELVTAVSCHAADLVFTLSEHSKHDISRAYRVPRAKIAVTYAGVDSSFTATNRSHPRKDDAPFVLMYCGRLNGPREQKGIDVLLRSLPMVIRHQNVVLNIVGTGPRLDQYRALAEQLSIQAHVRFLGFVEHDEMPAQYTQADLFVLPSRRESFGLVLAEAMACGLPVVATTAGAIPEVVEHGVTGLLVPPGDPEALAGAINSLLRDPLKMKTMGTNARRRVKKQFTWEEAAQAITKGYQRVLQVR
jgi:glycosyltransferase involved in cell wall biosynthesis